MNAKKVKKLRKLVKASAPNAPADTLIVGKVIDVNKPVWLDFSKANQLAEALGQLIAKDCLPGSADAKLRDTYADVMQQYTRKLKASYDDDQISRGEHEDHDHIMVYLRGRVAAYGVVDPRSQRGMYLQMKKLIGSVERKIGKERTKV